MESGQCSVCRIARAKFACSCAFPPISTCAACLVTHLESPGSHIPVPIEQEDPHVPVQGESEVCDECGAKIAVKFCVCSVPFKQLCEGCHFAHYQKAPGMAHFQHPMTAYQAVASGRLSFEEFQKKQLFIHEFQKRIEEELARFDAFAKQVAAEFDTLLIQLTAKKEFALSHLQAKRSQLAAQTSRIQQTIDSKRYAESAEAETALDAYIVTGYLSTSPHTVKMFSGHLKLQGIEEILTNAFAAEVFCEWEREEELGQDIPVLKGNSLRLFNRITLQMDQIELDQRTSIDTSAAYCYIGSTTLLAVGGGSKNEAYEVNISSGKVDKVANMLVSRGLAGIIKYKEYAYVIGGYNAISRCLNTGEKYAITSKSWISLPNPMQRAKSYCSVCEHTSGLYISGADPNYSCSSHNSGSSIEHFNPLTETFRLLRTDAITRDSILCCVGEELYHIRQNQMEVARLSSEPVAFTVKATIPPIGSGRYWLCCPSKVLDGELIFVLNIRGELMGLFSLKPVQGQFVQIANFTY